MTTQFAFETTAEEAAKALSSHIRGKTILITGVSKGGIGLETARALASQQPAELILAGRSEEKVAEAEEAIKLEAPGLKLRKLIFDLGVLDSVRKGASELNTWPDLPKIDVLINNAAIMACPYTLTPDGLEAQFATNHLGHFLFTGLVIGKIIAAGTNARVINVSSRGHRYHDVRLDDWNWEKGGYEPFKGYGQSKTANMLYAIALARRLKPMGIQVYSLHPGGIKTNLVRYIPRENMIDMGYWDKDGNPIDSKELKWKTVPQGASTTVVAAFDPSIADQSGSYLEDCTITEPVLPYAKDPERAERLWDLSEELVGQKFVI